MKIPKTVIISSKEWKIRQYKSKADGWFDFAIHEMGIGTKYKSEVLKILLHEILETIIAARLHRYKIYDEGNEKLLFSFDHADFDLIIQDLAMALKDIIKKE